MKKLFALLMVVGALMFGLSSSAISQNDTTSGKDTTQTATDTTKQESTTKSEPVVPSEEKKVEKEKQPFHQVVKTKFIEGGWDFMSTVLICLILGLAVALEKIISLSLATTNTKKLVKKVEDALNSGGVEKAKEVTRNTRGPVASIFTQGLMRISEGIDMVEKSVISYGSVEMGKLEKGISWISLFIALAPMLGFMGTVIGMIDAFDQIQAAGDVSPQIVAGGIKVALITTVSGLIVAIILQIFYNYIVSKVDSIVNQMEEASIALIDVLVQHKVRSEQ
ncbi:MotA/TolQ/ExbB proton channel family protein [Microscilla marina]|uniref:MotA/TolQ/ExbB proton channel family protein n=1 Tax=Microscilla marina ATCC 23134 TaxID=313606 RepID=A2A0Q2_MICM2|nr:MotA/TolQ/ExbB proton channel family protein [Microscilla marina]EAY23787.1 MotA/TolQ/ExbB proton channel family protein [Microscilla marina ATCC 23134]